MVIAAPQRLMLFTNIDGGLRYPAAVLDYRRLVSWVALDDNDDGWPPDARHRLVLCAPEFGLSLQRTKIELHEKLLSSSDATRA